MGERLRTNTQNGLKTRGKDKSIIGRELTVIEIQSLSRSRRKTTEIIPEMWGDDIRIKRAQVSCAINQVAEAILDRLPVRVILQSNGSCIITLPTKKWGGLEG